MKKTLIASSIALVIGGSSSAYALHIEPPRISPIYITQLDFEGFLHGATGTLNSNGNGSIVSVVNDNFFGSPWQADQQNWFDSSGSYTWAGTGTQANASDAFGDFTYTFSLSFDQIAVGTFFDWNGNNNIPILTIYDCPSSISGIDKCQGNSLPAATNPFPGAEFNFNGATSPVPIPAAAWLMGSGLIGLIGVARRKKK